MQADENKLHVISLCIFFPWCYLVNACSRILRLDFLFLVCQITFVAILKFLIIDLNDSSNYNRMKPVFIKYRLKVYRGSRYDPL